MYRQSGCDAQKYPGNPFKLTGEFLYLTRSAKKLHKVQTDRTEHGDNNNYFLMIIISSVIIYLLYILIIFDTATKLRFY